MKKVFMIFALALILITLCMIYLLKKGVSLRPEGLITPSIITENFQNVAPAIVARLFPNLQESDYVIFGWLPMTADSQKVFENLQQEYQKSFGHPVNILDYVQNPNDEILKACSRPCWVLVKQDQAHQLQKNDFIEKKILPLQKPFFTMTWLPFIAGGKVSDYCLSEQRLDFDCFKMLSIQKAERKIKSDKRYFFVNSYNEIDYFLFVQETKAL